MGMVGWQQTPLVAPDPLLRHCQHTVAPIEVLDAARRSVLMSPPREALPLRAFSDHPRALDALRRHPISCWTVLITERARRPLFAITSSPAAPETTLFIENQSAFASQLRAGFPARNLAVCAFGYGLTLENLDRRLNDGSVIACPAAGERPDLAKVVRATPCLFWGDRDLEGLRIFEALRRAIPHLQLSAVYAQMTSLLAEGRTSHPYSGPFRRWQIGAASAQRRYDRGSCASCVVRQ